MNINEKEIEQASRKIDLGGFNMNDELNPKIWDKEEKMRSDVKKTLLKIADDYFESLDLPGVDIEDVTMTGSLANYNWSKYSDVDLHIVVDYDDLPMDRELVQDFLKSKSSAWNKEHDVKIYGYDVELYVQDINEPHHSTGVYSVLNNEWNVKPEKKKISFSDKSVIDKANRLMDRIEDIYDDMGTDDNEDIIKRVDKLTEKIKKMRQSGLESGGEFSVENIVFKVLRRNGMLDRLYDIKTVAYDKSVTLESENLDRLIESLDGGDGLDWIREIGLPDVYVGAKFKTPNGNTIVVYETDEFTTSYVVIDGNGRKREQSMATKGFIHMIEAGLFWEIIDDETPINESELDDMDWIRDVDITNHMKPPYFKNMKEYGLSPNEYNSVLSKTFNQPVKYKVTVQGYIVYDKHGNRIYSEYSTGYWEKWKYDKQGNNIYYGDSNGNVFTRDNRNLNESDDFDWIRDTKPEPIIGSCIVDKLDPSQTRWTVESEGETPGGTEVIDVGNGKKTLSLNKKFFLEDYYNGRYVFCDELVNESDEMDWIRDVEVLPIPGTAWIMEINSEDSEEVQQKLFDAGFGWSHGGKKINETSGISAFVSYGGYDIKYNGFKMVIGDTYDSDFINHVIRQVQPNDLYFYEYKNGVSNLKDTDTLNESDELDWIRDTKPEPIIGSCIMDKLDPSQTMWTIESERKTLSGTDVINVSDGEKNVSLNKKFFLEDYYNGRYVFCNELVNESDEMDWIKDVKVNPFSTNPLVVIKFDNPITTSEAEQIVYWLKEIDSNVFKNYDYITPLVDYSSKGGYIYSYMSSRGYMDFGFGSDVSLFNRYKYDSVKSELRNTSYKEYKSSELFGNNINESDDMDWIRDVDITNHMKPPYFKNMKEYGLKVSEYESTLSKIFNQPVKYKVTVQGYVVYDKQGNRIYSETSGGWVKREYDDQGNNIYYEHSNGYWQKYEYDDQGNRIYYQNSNGEIEDNRNLNESDDFDWIREVEPMYIPKTGDKVRCKPGFSNNTNNIMWFKSPTYGGAGYREGKEFIVGSVTKETSDLHEIYGEAYISWPENDHLGVFNWALEPVTLNSINESDEFDWIRDTKPSLNMDSNWMLINDVDPNSYEESKLIQEFLFDLGYKWYSSKGVQQVKINDIQHFNSESLKGDLTYCSPNEKSMTECGMKNHENIYYWSEIKPNNLNESDEFDWIREIDPIRVGDVFHTRLDFTPKDLSAEVTFEIYDISPDGKWVRFKHHTSSMYKGTYIDIDKINSETISRGWDKRGYSRANSSESKQVIKNITTGFWKKVDVPGYLDLHPEKKDEIIQLGTNINESDEIDWIRDTGLPSEYGVDFKKGRHHIKVDGLTTDEKEKIQQIILNKGITWGDLDKNVKKGEYYADEGVYYYVVTNGFLLVGRGPSEEEGIKYIDGGLFLDYNKHTINESDDFDWVKNINPIPLEKNDFVSLNNLIWDYFDTNGLMTYDGWSYGIFNNGRKIIWTHPDFEDLIIMATPFSDDEYSMSIEFQVPFEHETIDTVKLPIFKYESELTDWLSNEYPQIVLETIEWGMGDYTDEIYLRNE